MSMRILVTGAGGFIGRELVVALQSSGVDVVGIDDLSAPGARLIDGVRRQRVEELTVHEVVGFDTVIHLAAAKRVDASFHDLQGVGRNVHADSRMFELAYGAGVRRLVFASTCEVYGRGFGRANAEGDRPAPISPYAVGKLASENILLSTHELHPRTRITILRQFNVYGPEEAPPAVVPNFLTARARGMPLVIEGTGGQKRDFSSVCDTVKMLTTIVHTREVPTILNVGSGVATSVADLARAVSALGVGPQHVEKRRGRPNEIPCLQSDTRLWRASLGPIPSRPVDVGLHESWLSMQDPHAPRHEATQPRLTGDGTASAPAQLIGAP